MQLILDFSGSLSVDGDKTIFEHRETSERISVSDYSKLSDEDRDNYFFDLIDAMSQCDNSDISMELDLHDS